MKRNSIEIIRMYGKLADRDGNNGKNQSLELNLLKWKDGKPVYDLRWWTDDEPMYGISLTERSLAELGEMISDIFAEAGK